MLIFCTCLVVPHTANAFFCMLNKGSGSKGFSRTMSAPRPIRPVRGYRLPPIRLAPAPVRYRGPIKRPPPRPLSWRPIN